MATVVSSPVSKAANLGSNPGYLTFSGTGPVSGVSGVGYFSGPFYVETQELTYSYKRVPYFSFSHGNISLSSMNEELNTWSTVLLVKISKALVRKEKVYDWYETSSYIQPQRFTVYSASADETGQTYGTPAAGTMCVGGLVDTTQPWYFRRPWDASLGDNESDMGVFPLQVKIPGASPVIQDWFGDAYNYTVESSLACSVSATPQNPIDYPWSENIFWACFDTVGVMSIKAPTPSFPGMETCEQTLPGAGGFTATNIIKLNTLGQKVGTYSTDQDDAGDIQLVTDMISDLLAMQIINLDPRQFTRSPDGLAVNNPEYAKSRHYWGG
tara:strand:+ start:1694 stop:2671 length:978 start_codon:yes stop_codon:yes gene_type:complete